MTKEELLTLWDEWFDGAAMDETMESFLRAVIHRERERIAKLIESQVWPREYEMFPGFQSWKVTVEVLAKQVRES